MQSVRTLDPEEHTLYDLHIGIDPERVAEFAENYIGWPDPDGEGWLPAVFTGPDLGDGTSWEQWGEEPWRESTQYDHPGPELGEHVIVRCTSVVSALMCLAAVRESGFDLVPMRFKNQRGVIAAVSRADDWAESYLSILAGRRYGDLVPVQSHHLIPDFTEGA